MVRLLRGSSTADGLLRLASRDVCVESLSGALTRRSFGRALGVHPLGIAALTSFITSLL